MAAIHGTQRRYVEGCRCEDCKEAHRAAARDYRERRASGLTRPASVAAIPSAVAAGPGPVEAGVEAEIAGLAEAEARLGLAAVALAVARILDNPKAVSSHPPAAKVLATLLDRLRSASARGRRGGLAVVRAMAKAGTTDAGGAAQ